MRELEAPNAEALAIALERLLSEHSDLDTRLVRRLRSLAHATAEEGLTGRLLERTLERGGWNEVETREVERHRSEQLVLLDKEIAARRSEAEKVDKERHDAVRKAMGELEARLETARAGVKDQEERAAAATRTVATTLSELKELRRSIVAEVREDLRKSEGVASSREISSSTFAPPIWPEGSVIHSAMATDQAFAKAARTKGVDEAIVRKAFCTAAAGLVALMDDDLLPIVSEIVASTVGAARITIHCDPGLLAMPDVLERSGVLDLLSSSEGQSRYVVLELVNLLAAPSSYWIEGFGGPWRRTAPVAENVLVLASPGATPDPNPVAPRQARALVPIGEGGSGHDLPIHRHILPYKIIDATALDAALREYLESPPQGVPPPFMVCLVRYRAVARQILGLNQRMVNDMVGNVARHFQAVADTDAVEFNAVAAMLGRKRPL